MKLKFLKRGLLIAAFVLLTPFATHAAVDRVIIDSPGLGIGDLVGFGSYYMDGGTLVEFSGQQISVGTSTTQIQLIDKMKQAVTDYSALAGYPTNLPYVFTFSTQKDIDSAIAAATSTLNLPVAMSFATTTRSLNSAFQISATRATFVSYTVDVATTLSLTGGQTGTVSLQYADDSGFTTNVKTVQSSVNGNTGTLTLGLAITQTGTAAVTGMIPAGKYVKLVTANTTGTPTFTYRAGQEVLMASN